MTDVEFFLLESDQASAERFAAKLTQSAFRQCQPVHVHCKDQAAIEQFSDLLWQYSQSSFLAHESNGSPAPITIGQKADDAKQFETLVCFDNLIPDFFSRFSKLQFVVAGDDVAKQQAREHYRFFKKRGHPLQHKNIAHTNF